MEIDHPSSPPRTSSYQSIRIPHPSDLHLGGYLRRQDKRGRLNFSHGRQNFFHGMASSIQLQSKRQIRSRLANKAACCKKLAEQILSIKALLYSQWFKGEYNVGTDSLSRDCLYLKEESHKCMLKRFSPT